MERYLNFSLGKEEYAVPLLAVREVIAMPPVRAVPHTPPHFLGIADLRGHVISIIDLRGKLGIKASENADNSVIICDSGTDAGLMGVVVDSVNAVMTPDSKDFSERPTIESKRSTEYILGVLKKGDRLVLCLDLKKALDVADTKAMAQAQTSSTPGAIAA